MSEAPRLKLACIALTVSQPWLFPLLRSPRSTSSGEIGRGAGSVPVPPDVLPPLADDPLTGACEAGGAVRSVLIKSPFLSRRRDT